jgi:hypothetical protein
MAIINISYKLCQISAGQSEQMYYELLQKKDYLHYA